ncbi:hypothetical protein P154DRAFT_597115 [Amniculicola lignicola CBS 123094]|uniref:Asteroid domain-containing protein n=1 Tax=Amniculicola lignicola CBS 123094 TaxID=1392246 RepID=A0A6A5WZ75_9PLEO|nr:hypothetical protein P154DRAFT_597115 [Amniculicola lignicola CBS 123094]
MGVAGLTRFLEPYAVQCTSGDLKDYLAIIDGPALAYHAYSLASTASGTRTPSYADVNASAIRWLKSLEEMDIKVSAILFDGALPSSKKGERSKRLQQNVSRVLNYRSMNSTTACPIPRPLGSIIYPLLAPSLMETLSKSEFARIVRMVPGEADDWCAAAAQDSPRNIIFTSDSDLFLYEYPDDFLIMFFRDIKLWPTPELKMYSPTNICKRMQLDNLTTLAFTIQEDSTRTTSQAIVTARGIDVSDREYVDFTLRYVGKAKAPPHFHDHPEVWEVLHTLDARVSEFMMQVLEGDTQSTPDVYLPLLLEDPLQGAAWKVGQDIRLLAYSLLTGRQLLVREWKRKAQSVTGHTHALYSSHDMATYASELAETIKEWATSAATVPTRQLPVQQQWSLLVIRLCMDDLKAPNSALLVRAVSGVFETSWDNVHLTARLQAGLYSLRMLQQCITIWLALNSGQAGTELHNLISGLHEALMGMPSIQKLFVVPGEEVTSSPEANARLLQAIKQTYAASGVKDESFFAPPKSRRQKKRDKRSKKQEYRARQESPGDESPQQELPQAMSNNAFAVLDQQS